MKEYKSIRVRAVGGLEQYVADNEMDATWVLIRVLPSDVDVDEHNNGYEEAVSQMEMSDVEEPPKRYEAVLLFFMRYTD